MLLKLFTNIFFKISNIEHIFMHIDLIEFHANTLFLHHHHLIHIYKIRMSL